MLHEQARIRLCGSRRRIEQAGCERGFSANGAEEVVSARRGRRGLKREGCEWAPVGQCAHENASPGLIMRAF